MANRDLVGLEQIISSNMGSCKQLGMTSGHIHPKTQSLMKVNQNFKSTINGLNPAQKKQHQKFPVQGLARSYFSLTDLN